jgi:hypothetical protein
MQGHPSIWGMTWAPDGRATFEYGDEVHPSHSTSSGAASARIRSSNGLDKLAVGCAQVNTRSTACPETGGNDQKPDRRDPASQAESLTKRNPPQLVA